jgi:hypothetical protein
MVLLPIIQMPGTSGTELTRCHPQVPPIAQNLFRSITAEVNESVVSVIAALLMSSTSHHLSRVE